MPKSPKNYIEIHCWFGSDKGARYDKYELVLHIGNTEFVTDDFIGRSSAMRAAKRISAATRFPIKETTDA